MDNKLEQAINFFQQEKGLHRLLQLLIKKYKGLGRMGGSVKLTELKDYEQEALSSFFGKDFSKKQSAIISFKEFSSTLSKTKFDGVDEKDLLSGYIGQNLLTKEEEKALYEEKKRAFFEKFIKKYSHSNCQLWLKYIANKKRGTGGIHQSYDTNPKLLKIYLQQVLLAISKLPEDGYERLPLFAQGITKDPHGFDINTEQGRLLLSALQCIRESKERDFQYVTSPSAEQINEILQFFNLVRDDIQNFVTCAGIIACSAEGHALPLWEVAWKNKNVLNIPLRELVKVRKCFPGNKQRKVFVVENSGVFSALLDYLKSKKEDLPPLICTHGQFKLATLMLLDKLAENNSIIYYAGDFDPEGLQMAQRLALRYPNGLKLWHYTVEDYEKAISENRLKTSRLKKLNSILVSELLPVKKKILEIGKAGYQEELVDDMAKDILTL